MTLEFLLGKIGFLLGLIIPILFVLATVVFLWGIIQFLTAAGDETKLKEGKKRMLWGIIGLAVMLAVWGLARMLALFFTGSSAFSLPIIL